MDSEMRSAPMEQVDTGRRRRWSEDQKLEMISESLNAPRRRDDLRFAHIVAPMETVVSPRANDISYQPGFVAAMMVAE